MAQPARGPRVLLLTGVPGIGKTTVVRRVAERLAGVRLGGFTTEEIREGGVRRGFRLVGCDGTRSVIAHVSFPKQHRVGRYGVAVAAVDAAAARLLADPDAELILVDEIGKMECLSAPFVAAMRRLLSGGAPLVATVGLRGGGFPAEVRAREDAVLWEVTRDNRDALPERILAWLREIGVGRS